MSDRIEMTIKLQVTPAQGLALQTMMNHWNLLSSWGSSRYIAFYVDGDGNFHPKAECRFSGEIPELTEEMEKKAISKDDGDGNLGFDFDGIAWALHD